MDSKLALLSGILALLLVSSGAVLLLGDENSNNDENPDEAEQNDAVLVNTPPSILIQEYLNISWDGNSVSVSGFVVDESVSTTQVSMAVIDSSSLEQIGAIIQGTPNVEGEFQVNTLLSQPGTWLLQFDVVDSEGLKSDVSTSTLTITPPDEEDVTITLLERIMFLFIL